MKVGIKEDLRRLFKLTDMIWAERLYISVIPKIVSNISSPNLISIMKDHAVSIEQQIKRLQRISELMSVSARGKKCVVTEVLINESMSALEYTQHGPFRDAAIIAIVQKIGHYGIAAYGTMVNFGKVLGENTIVDILNRTLSEKKETDALLSDAANNTINFDAAIDENKFLASHYYKGNTL